MNKSITLVLPYPLSANRYWRSFIPRGATRPVVCLSEEAKQYKADVQYAARQAGVMRPYQGRVSVHIALYPKRPKDAAKRARTDPDNWEDTVRCIDIDNARKILYDALSGILFADDKLIWRDSAERMSPHDDGRVIVTVSTIERALIQPQHQEEM